MRRLAVLSIALFACGDLSKTEPNAASKEQIAKARLAYETSPNDPQKVVALADAYADGNKLIEAADGYQKAIELGVQDARVFGTLAAIYVKFGYLQASVDQLRSCMGIDRNHPDCLYAVGTLFEMDGTREMQGRARTAFRAMLDVAPNHPKAALVKSKVDQLDSRLGPAAAAEEGDDHPAEEGEATEDAPPSPKGQDPHAGIPGHESGLPANAEGEVGELNPFGQALQKAFNAVKDGDPLAAEKAFREAITFEPKDPVALAGLSQALLAQNKKVEAITSAELAVASDGKNPDARYTLGLALLRGARNRDDAKRGLGIWQALLKDEPGYSKERKVKEQLDEIDRLIKQQSNVH